MIQVCVICKRIYGEKEPFWDKDYTHGYCPHCFELEIEKLKRQMKEMEERKTNIPNRKSKREEFINQKEIINELYRMGTIIEYGNEDHLLLLSKLAQISSYSVSDFHKLKSSSQIEFRLKYEFGKNIFRLEVVPMYMEGPYEERKLLDEEGNIGDLISLTEDVWEEMKLELNPPSKKYILNGTIVAHYKGGLYMAIILPPIGKIISQTEFYKMIQYFEEYSPKWRWEGD